MIQNTSGLSRSEIYKIVNHYIGVSAGYLGDFSYPSHHDFYLEYCNLEHINPYDYEGTTRERFITILSEQHPKIQAIILQGILEKYPVGSDELRTQVRYEEIKAIITRLRQSASVASPAPKITSEVVLIAIQDAETLINNNSVVSGIDRIYTALHGYLKAACRESNIDVGEDPSITTLFKLIRSEHPAFSQQDSQYNAVTKILRSSSAILDALSPIRNRGSLAHPNENLLEEPEALLYINIARSLIHYLDYKISQHSENSFNRLRNGQDSDEIPF